MGRPPVYCETCCPKGILTSHVKEHLVVRDERALYSCFYAPVEWNVSCTVCHSQVFGSGFSLLFRSLCLFLCGYMRSLYALCNTSEHLEKMQKENTPFRSMVSLVSARSLYCFFCRLVTNLAKDVQEDFYQFFGEFFQIFIDHLFPSADPEVLEWTFGCLCSLFKVLKRPMLKDLQNVFRYVQLRVLLVSKRWENGCALRMPRLTNRLWLVGLAVDTDRRTWQSGHVQRILVTLRKLFDVWYCLFCFEQIDPHELAADWVNPFIKPFFSENTSRSINNLVKSGRTSGL